MKGVFRTVLVAGIETSLRRQIVSRHDLPHLFCEDEQPLAAQGSEWGKRSPGLRCLYGRVSSEET